jgi:D-glycero-alpha-D-manno-heptose 1-phosphate guanylyltransferase
MKLLVLAGGFGTRLQSVASEVPEALAAVGGVALLHLQIEHWKNQVITLLRSCQIINRI